MKKLLLLFMVVIATAKLQGQGNYQLTFAGTGSTPQTVIVENLTKGTSVNLQGSDILELKIKTGIHEIKNDENNKLVIYPNPMTHSCSFEFLNEQSGRVNIQVYSIDGIIIHTFSRDLLNGKHKFMLSGVISGTYTVVVKTASNIITGRFISISQTKSDFSLIHTDETMLQYDTTSVSEISSKTEITNRLKGSTIVNMDFTLGDQLKIIGMASGFANNTIYLSPTSSQTITFDFTNRFYRINGYKVTSSKPSFVDMLVSISDKNYKGVDNLTNTDFIVKENDIVVSPSESFRYIKSINTLPYTIKTVLMIDNSSSIASKLNEIKTAALNLVDNIVAHQEIAVYVFSDSPELICNFTSNVDSLTKAIKNIKLGYASTNLYGSYITGVNAWSDILSETEIQKGFLILFTDGDDTQGSSDLQQAVSARGDKSTYIIGLGNDLTPSVLNQLANPSPYYAAGTVSELPQIFKNIQQSILDYANSFYIVNYMSPKRNGQHTIKIEIADNENTGNDSYYQNSFSADGFESVTSGVYLNPYSKTPTTSKYGINQLDKLIGIELTAVTYWANEVPNYTWSSANTDIISVIPSNLYFNKASLCVNATGTTTITVNDVANSYSKTITVNTEKPTITTNAISNISYTSASCGGLIISDVDINITSRGVVWSTKPNPTINLITKTSDGIGTGKFESNITGLTANTTYYVRTYASNNLGTAYGNEISFTTMSLGSVTDFEGNIYKTIIIGTQIWMVENLKTTTYKDGSTIPNITDFSEWIALTSSAYCNYENNEAYVATYGRLYNWYAVKTGNLCPTGWHVPTYNDWLTLTNYIGGESITGGKLKEKGITHWYNPNEGATNETGFTALPGGYLDFYTSFQDILLRGYWWSSTQYDAQSAYHPSISFGSGSISFSMLFKEAGLSVRCIKDN